MRRIKQGDAYEPSRLDRPPTRGGVCCPTKPSFRDLRLLSVPLPDYAPGVDAGNDSVRFERVRSRDPVRGLLLQVSQAYNYSVHEPQTTLTNTRSVLINGVAF